MFCCRCLLDVYSALSQDPACFGLPQDLRSISSLQMEKSKEEKKEEKKQASRRGSEGRQEDSPQGPTPTLDPDKRPQPGEESQRSQVPPMPLQQLRVVCDNMLQGLGRYLHCLGVDVLLLENSDDHRVAA
uniref:Uncharacterized protein n=1 Tax=Hucho hucho TaxID=62062 RepID=A0A4W5MIT8_9TELE